MMCRAIDGMVRDLSTIITFLRLRRDINDSYRRYVARVEESAERTGHLFPFFLHFERKSTLLGILEKSVGK